MVYKNSLILYVKTGWLGHTFLSGRKTQGEKGEIAIPYAFFIQRLQHQRRRKCAAVFRSPCIYACVNTHVIKNSFGASVPVEELGEAGISIAGSH